MKHNKSTHLITTLGLLALQQSAYSQLSSGETIGIDFASPNAVFGAAGDGTSGNFIEFTSSVTDGDSETIALTQNLTGVAVTNVFLTVENNLGKEASLTGVTSNNTAVSPPFDGAEIFDDSWGGANVGNDSRADFGPLADGANIVLTFSGLDDSLTYDIKGGGNFGNNNFDTTWTSGDTTATTANGTTPFVTLSGLITDGSGNLSVTVERDAAQLLISAVTLTANGPTTDSDMDGIFDAFEELYFPGDLTALNGLAVGPGPGSDTGDFDGDGLTDLEEFSLITNGTFPSLSPIDEDSDDDTLLDGVESGSGVYVDASDTGTSPVNNDSDGDLLFDNVETNTGTFEDASDTGTNPNLTDSDGDNLSDGEEVLEAPQSNPNLVDSDGDTFNDDIERELGSNPMDINDLPDLSRGYTATGGDWLSPTAFSSVDINGNALGTDGFFFFGSFDGTSSGGNPFTTNVSLLPNYVTDISTGNDFDSVATGFNNYAQIDSPVLLDENEELAGFANTGNISGTAVEGDFFEIVTFNISGAIPGQTTIRVGILAGVEGTADGRWDPTGITLTDSTGNPIPEIEGNGASDLGANPGQTNSGWLFFDLATNGTYSVNTSYRGGNDGRGTGIGGLTFDSTGGTISPTNGIILQIQEDPTNSNNLLFSWRNTTGSTYNLLSNTDLSDTPTSAWAVVTGGANIAADDSGINTLSLPRPVNPKTFYVLSEE